MQIPKPTPNARALFDSLGGQAFGPAERPMSGYVSLPTNFTTATAAAWVDKSIAYVGRLPPKAPKQAKSK
jgi:hypothetical protein